MDTVDELLDDADVWEKPDWGFWLFQVVKSFGRIDPLPLVSLANVEVFEVFQIEHGVAAETLEPDFAAGETGAGEFASNPHVSHDVVFKHDLGHDGQWRAWNVAVAGGLGKNLDGVSPGEPTEEVGIV